MKKKYHAKNSLVVLAVSLFLLTSCSAVSPASSDASSSTASSVPSSVAAASAASPETASSSSLSESELYRAQLAAGTVEDVLTALTTSDGWYTEDCYAELASRLVSDPEGTLSAMVQSSIPEKLDAKGEANKDPNTPDLEPSGTYEMLGDAVCYIGATDEQLAAVRTALEGIGEDDPCYSAAVRVLDGMDRNLPS